MDDLNAATTALHRPVNATKIAAPSTDTVATSSEPSVAVAVSAFLLGLALLAAWIFWRSSRSQRGNRCNNLAQWAAHFIVYALSGKSRRVAFPSLPESKVLPNGKVGAGSRWDATRTRVDSRKYLFMNVEHSLGKPSKGANDMAAHARACAMHRRESDLTRRYPGAPHRMEEMRGGNKPDVRRLQELDLMSRRWWEVEEVRFPLPEEDEGEEEVGDETSEDDESSEWSEYEEDEEDGWSDLEDSCDRFDWESVPRASPTLSGLPMDRKEVGSRPKRLLRLPAPVHSNLCVGSCGRSVLELPEHRRLKIGA